MLPSRICILRSGSNVDDPNFAYFEYIDTVRPDAPCLLPEELQDRCGDLPIGSLRGE